MTLRDIHELKKMLRDFSEKREWEIFHSPKNLSMALIVEAAELVEHFQWLTEEESRSLPDETREAVRFELADIFVYLVRLADKLDIDLLEAAQEKMILNELKYPADQVRGSARRPKKQDVS